MGKSLLGFSERDGKAEILQLVRKVNKKIVEVIKAKQAKYRL